MASCLTIAPLAGRIELRRNHTQISGFGDKSNVASDWLPREECPSNRTHRPTRAACWSGHKRTRAAATNPQNQFMESDARAILPHDWRIVLKRCTLHTREVAQVVREPFKTKMYRIFRF